jgi:hypothetical protein
MSLDAVQKVMNRVSHEIEPHYEAMVRLARQASVGYMDETPWYCQNTFPRTTRVHHGSLSYTDSVAELIDERGFVALSIIERRL